MKRTQVYRAGMALLAMTGCAGAARAEHTREWRQSTYEEFLKGTARGVAVRSDGKLELAPKFAQIADADASYLWTIRTDPKGTVYTAGGTPAKVFRLEGNGKLSPVFESTELSAQAIAFDAKGTLYVGTSPDGKVYRVSANGEKTVFFDPKTKYIWDMAFGPDGTLYVATGDKGQIFAVAPDGKGEVFYASDEAHVRVLGFDGKGNLIAGTEPSGRVLRLTKSSGKSAQNEGAAEGFVLYETPKREVTALATGPDGSIYAAAIGERQHTAAQAPMTTVVSGTNPPTTTTVTGGGNVAVIGPTSGVVQGPSPFVPFPPLLTGSVYKISPDGAPEELWSSRDEVVYSLAMGADGRLLAGTGNNGTVLAIDGRGVFAQVAKAGSAQVTGILRGASGKTYLCMANPGKLAQLGPDYAEEGTFESRSFDGQLFSKWGRLDWWSGAEVKKAAEGAARLEFFVRSGNTEDPGKEWSRWFGPYTTPGSSVEAPAARFAQWKAVIHNGKPGDGIDWVSLSYQPHNVAPVIDGIAVQDPGVQAQGITVVSTGRESAALRMPSSQSGTGTVVVTQGNAAKFDSPPQGFREKGWQSVLWSAHDDNDDDLRYAVYFRGENEKQWKLLKDKLEQKFLAFDTTSLPDGAYYLKIVADDSESNPPAEAKRAERESERFVVDNTPPAIEKLEAAAMGRSGNPSTATAHVSFTASDGASAINRAQYSVDGGDWILLAPKSGISDSKSETYDFTVSGLSAGEHIVAVRAYDQFENVGSGKATVAVTNAKP